MCLCAVFYKPRGFVCGAFFLNLEAAHVSVFF